MTSQAAPTPRAPADGCSPTTETTRTTPAAVVRSPSGAATYELRLSGHLDDHWSGMLGDLALVRHDDDTTTLTGTLVDQTQLHGVLARVRDLGVTILSLRAVEDAAPWVAEPTRPTRSAATGSGSAPPRRTTPTPPGPTGASGRESG